MSLKYEMFTIEWQSAYRDTGAERTIIEIREAKAYCKLMDFHSYLEKFTSE